VFFPFAFTGVCSGELRDLRDHADRLAETGAEVLAVSCDTMFTLRVLAEQESLELPLLSDFWPHGEVASAYGVLDTERGCPTRSTFVIDRDGVVRWAVHNAMGEARDIGDLVRELGAARPS
jgi:peroxiredoxin